MHALVTGASSGIGEALAARLADAGYDLTLVARREAALERVAAGLPSSRRSHIEVADVANLEGLASVVARAEAALGPVDALINNAGVQIVAPTEEVDPAEGEKLLTVNVLAPLRLTLTVLDGMLERGKGVIVDISSLAGLAPTPGMYHYNASKAAIAAASESLRAEVADRGVHVVTVYPGPVKTAMADAALARYADSKTAQGLPTGTPDELAHKIVTAMHDGTPRIIYPSSYAAARHFPALTRWVLDRFSPTPESTRS